MAADAPALPTPLIRAEALRRALQAGLQPVLLDCSFDLADGGAGARAFAAGHLPGARYVHLDHDLSGPKPAAGPVAGGRHPLPDRAAFAGRVASWGIQPDTPVVVYDAMSATYAARAWWMLRWLGHQPVAVLDGGLQAWQAAGGELQPGESPAPGPQAAAYPLTAAALPVVTADGLLGEPGRWAVVDARAPERFRGDVEPLDSRAGHIPGARNRFFRDNLDATGHFLPAETLRATFGAWGVAPAQIVHQCGSGVTACHNLLAMEVAGLAGACLYPGSWSEWSADPSRPVALGS